MTAASNMAAAVVGVVRARAPRFVAARSFASSARSPRDVRRPSSVVSSPLINEMALIWRIGVARPLHKGFSLHTARPSHYDRNAPRHFRAFHSRHRCISVSSICPTYACRFTFLFLIVNLLRLLIHMAIKVRIYL